MHYSPSRQVKLVGYSWFTNQERHTENNDRMSNIGRHFFSEKLLISFTQNFHTWRSLIFSLVVNSVCYKPTWFFFYGCLEKGQPFVSGSHKEGPLYTVLQYMGYTLGAVVYD